MGRLFYLTVFVLIAMGLGCAVVDYPLIENQYTGEIENTNGKAMLTRFYQQAYIWPDGADNLFSMVDQKANGDQTLYTYNFYTTDGSYFLDWDYCHPDWNGCAVVTAPNPLQGDVMFDYTLNDHCLGARSLLLLDAPGARYTECGRSRMSALDRASFLASLERLSPSEVRVRLNRRNTRLQLANTAGREDRIPIYGQVPVTMRFRSGTAYTTVDLLDPIFGNTLVAVHDWVVRHQDEVTTVSATIDGFDVGSYDVLLLEEGLARAANR